MVFKQGEDNPNYKGRLSLGRKLSEEAKRKIGKSSKGRNIGRKHTKEELEKMRQNMLGEKNPMYGKEWTTEQRERQRQACLGINRGEKNGYWKGDGVQRVQLHRWVRNNLPEPELCQMCNKKPPYDLANITGKYTRDLTNWAYYCRKCHMVSDDRIYNLKQYRDRMM